MSKKPRATKGSSGLHVIHDPATIPSFESEAEEAAFWDNHTYSEEMLESAQRVPLAGDGVLPPARPRASPKRAVSVRLDEDTLARLKRLATKKATNYQTLLKNFVNERLYEEEKREGML